MSITSIRAFAFYSSAFIILFLLSAENSKASITYVQSISSSAGGVTSLSAAFSQANTSGNLIIACARWSGATMSASPNVSDIAGNTYTSFPNEPIDGAGGTAACWYAPNIKAGNNTVGLTFSVYVNVYLTVLEYAGAAPVSPFDVEAHATGSSNAPNSGLAAVTASGDLIFGYGGAINDSGDPRTPGTGFMARKNYGFLAEDQIAGTAGAYAAKMWLGYSGGGIGWIMVMGSFKSASSDTAPPTVSITAPVSGQSVSGAVAVTANATDDVAVANVQFLLDGTNLGTPVTAMPYSVTWNTQSAMNGPHNLSATATNVGGLTTTSAVVAVTVNNPVDSGPPSVSISSPISGQTVGGIVGISANASDDVAVASVQFLLDGANLGSAVATAPYSISWNTASASNGTHTLLAVATDVGGLRTTSASVSVVVSNAMSISYVQSAAISQGGTTSLLIPFNAKNNLGNLIIVCSRWSGASNNSLTANISDSLGNVYTSFPNEPVTEAVGGAACWYAPNIRPGLNTVSITYSASASAYATALEYSGILSASPFDVESHATGLNNSPDSGFATTSTGGDLIFGYGGALDDTGDNRTAGSLFTARMDNGFLAEDNIAGAPGAYHANLSLAYGSENWVMIMGSFKPIASDNTPPTVSMTSPTSGQTVAGLVQISATAADNVGVNNVQFQLDGVNLGTAISTAPYSLSWNTIATANGTHSVAAIATDMAGLRTTSAAVAVIVNNPIDSAPPTISITSPVAGQTLTGTVTVSANAADDVAVTSVQFSVDGSSLNSPITTTPYSATWNTATVANGTHTVTAVATDTAGFSASSNVTVTVSNSLNVVIPTNTWVNVNPNVVMLSGFDTGSFGTETWSDSCYDPITKRMILLQDYVESPGRYPYTIYANTVWAFDAAAQTLSMLKVDNWFNSTPGLSYTTSPFPSNTTDPTPADREFFFTCVPDKNYLFTFAGANKGIQGNSNQPNDTWTFNLGATPGSPLIWTQLFPANTPQTGLDHIWSSMTYDPSTRNIVIPYAHGVPYGVNDTWMFNIDTQAYTEVTSSPQPQFLEAGANATDYDSNRKLVWLFGAGPNVYASGGNELWNFNSSTQTWTQVFPVGGPPPARIWHGFVYISKYDKFLLWGGTASELNNAAIPTDTWIYDPQANTWTKLPLTTSPGSGPFGEFVYMVYDPANDVVIANPILGPTTGPTFWIFRYAP